MFGCNHNWEVIKDKTLKSPKEQSKGRTRGRDIPYWFFKKKSITILQCTKCGKLDKTVETNP